MSASESKALIILEIISTYTNRTSNKYFLPLANVNNREFILQPIGNLLKFA